MASSVSRFLAELKRRKVYRVAAIYVVVGFAVWQAADFAVPALNLPDTASSFIFLLTVLGFPIALVLAWAFEVRPDSSRETPEPVPDPGSAPDESAPASEPSPRGRSVAVLPFESLSADPEGDYFADGISEELTNALARQKGLRVAARTSAFAFKGERLDVREIGKRLEVSHVIEGSVRRAGQTLRITAQLIDTSNGYHVWSEQFDREQGDVFRIQEEISESVVRGLLDEVPGDVAPVVTTGNLDAYDAFLRGRQAVSDFGITTIQQAVQEFEKSIALDETFAPAHAGLVEALTIQAIAFSDRSPREAMDRARIAADRALEVGPNLPEAHLAAALALMFGDFAFDAAKASFDRALEINPNYAEAYFWFEFYWTYASHDFERAVAANERARQLSPLDSRLPLRLATVHYIFGNLKEAERIQRTVLAEAPNNALAHLGLSDTLLRQGDFHNAIPHAEKAVSLAGRPTPWLGMLCGFYGVQGNRSAAEEVIEELEARSEAGYVSGFWMAVAQAGTGRLDQAFASLQRAVNDRDPNLLYLIAAPRNVGLREDPRLPGILTQIGLGHHTKHL
jgi:TolB-like protein/tetratricopeptide (TPR) repeat protein